MSKYTLEKKDNKLVEELVKEFSPKELARMVVRERKKKNKYLSEIKSSKETNKVNILDDEYKLTMIKQHCNVINKPCNNKGCGVKDVCKLNYEILEIQGA